MSSLVTSHSELCVQRRCACMMDTRGTRRCPLWPDWPDKGYAQLHLDKSVGSRQGLSRNIEIFSHLQHALWDRHHTPGCRDARSEHALRIISDAILLNSMNYIVWTNMVRSIYSVSWAWLASRLVWIFALASSFFLRSYGFKNLLRSLNEKFVNDP